MNPTLRPLEQSERAFVLSAWLRSYRNAPAVRLVDNPTYFSGQSRSILSLLDRASCTVAADPQDDAVLWGFIVTEGQALRYVYVKHLLRRNGIARALWQAAGRPRTVDVLTHAGEAILKANPGVLHFDPYSEHRSPAGQRERHL
jgi:hypothetical protein